MKRRDKTVLAILATGLLLSAYITAPATSAGGGACLAIFPLLSGDNSMQQIANTGPKNRVAPDWQLNNLEGKAVKLSDFKGKVLILNFWATWCPPCRREIPDFVALQKQYGDKGLVVIGVSMDEGGAEVAKPFVKKMGINYPVVIGDQKTAAAYGGIQVVPTTFVIDETGKIVARHEGGADRATFEAEIRPLL